MKIGDLVKIKYDGVVAIVARIDSAPNYYQYGSSVVETDWFWLIGQPIPFKANRLEVISASR